LGVLFFVFTSAFIFKQIFSAVLLGLFPRIVSWVRVPLR